MRKLIIVVAIFLTLGIALSACHSSKPCPAYGQVEVEMAEENG